MSTMELIEHMTNTNLSNRILFPSSDERKSVVRFAEALGMVRSAEVALAPIPTRSRFLVKSSAR